MIVTCKWVTPKTSEDHKETLVSHKCLDTWRRKERTTLKNNINNRVFLFEYFVSKTIKIKLDT